MVPQDIARSGGSGLRSHQSSHSKYGTKSHKYFSTNSTFQKNIPDKLPGIFVTKDEDNEVVKFKDVLFPPETDENQKAEEGGIFSSSLFSFSTFMNTHPPVLEPGNLHIIFNPHDMH